MVAFRQYQPSDNEAVWELHISALQQAGAYLGSGPWDADLQHIERDYLSQQGEFLVGVEGDRLIAMGALRRTSPDRAEIKRMRVHPDYQSQGIGQRLLDLLEQRARSLGYAWLHLDTSVRQPAALHLYQKNGYRETHRKTIQGLELIYMEKALPPNHDEEA
jgi:ribosomal protein S18 acetylase RimI-like enzyme